MKTRRRPCPTCPSYLRSKKSSIEMCGYVVLSLSLFLEGRVGRSLRSSRCWARRATRQAWDKRRAKVGAHTKNSRLRRQTARQSNSTTHARVLLPGKLGPTDSWRIQGMTRGTPPRPVTAPRPPGGIYWGVFSGSTVSYVGATTSGTRFGRLYASRVPSNTAPGRCRHAA